MKKDNHVLDSLLFHYQYFWAIRKKDDIESKDQNSVHYLIEITILYEKVKHTIYLNTLPFRRCGTF